MNIFKTLLLCGIGLAVSAQAQEYKLTDPIPVDNNVRIGKLPNGITYFIRKNSLPENRVEMRLAVNAGSILEDEDQQGLAHFNEHMSFNGTKHFEKNELISYLQSVGVKFGENLNAYTSFDETVYRILVPTDKADVVDKAFLILEDWAHNVTFDPKEIEAERGVISQEWRIGRGASQRLQDKYFPVLFHDSRYAQRLPIGKIDVIQNFKRDAITRFYNDWYRPDLMAVIVVGDIDVNQYEKMIKDRFGAIPARKNERPRIVYDVPDHASTLYTINTDPEMTQTQVMIYSKIKHKEETTLADYRRFIIEQLYYFMMNQRYGTLSRSANPPFVYARSSFSPIARSKDAFSVTMQVRDNGVEKGLKAAATELERAKRFGFTQSELDRAKKYVTMKYQRSFAEKDKSASDDYASELIRHFLTNEPIPGISFEYAFTMNQLPTITLKEINDFDDAFLSDSNRVIIVNAPEKDKASLPTQEGLAQIVKEVSESSLEPYSEKTVAFVWPGKKPVAGSIVKEEKDNSLGLTKLTLSNGVKVYLKPTNFKNDEVYTVAYSNGGYNFCPDSDYYSALYAASMINESGIANLSRSDMVKAFAGKDFSAKLALSSANEGISGKSSPKDLASLMQLNYLYFTQAKIDSSAYVSFIKNTKTTLENVKLDPKRYFQNQVAHEMSCNAMRGGGFPEVSDLDKVNYKRSQEILRERFANAADFDFVILGSFNIDSIKPLIETYIASLPANSSRESCKDLGIRPPKGNFQKIFYKGSDQKSNVNMIFTGKAKFNPKEEYLLGSLKDILTIKLTENLREKMSGVYGVRVHGVISKYPYENYQVRVTFECAPDMADKLIKATLDEVDKIKTSGVDAATLEKVKETQKRAKEINLKDNVFWTNELVEDLINGVKIDKSILDSKQIDELSSKQMKETAKKYFGKNYAKFVLYPENYSGNKSVSVN